MSGNWIRTINQESRRVFPTAQHRESNFWLISNTFVQAEFTGQRGAPGKERTGGKMKNQKLTFAERPSSKSPPVDKRRFLSKWSLLWWVCDVSGRPKKEKFFYFFPLSLMAWTALRTATIVRIGRKPSDIIKFIQNHCDWSQMPSIYNLLEVLLELTLVLHIYLMYMPVKRERAT